MNTLKKLAFYALGVSWCVVNVALWCNAGGPRTEYLALFGLGSVSLWLLLPREVW